LPGHIGIKMSARISAGVDDCPCFSFFFITMIPVDCKITIFYLFTFFGDNYNIGELTNAISKEKK